MIQDLISQGWSTLHNAPKFILLANKNIRKVILKEDENVNFTYIDTEED
jgi:hypothetical protein